MINSIRHAYYNRYLRLSISVGASILCGFFSYSLLDPPNIYESVVCNSAKLSAKTEKEKAAIDCTTINKELISSTSLKQTTLGVIGLSAIWLGVFSSLVTIHSAFESKPKKLNGFTIKKEKISKPAKKFLQHFASTMADFDIISRKYSNDTLHLEYFDWQRISSGVDKQFVMVAFFGNILNLEKAVQEVITEALDELTSVPTSRQVSFIAITTSYYSILSALGVSIPKMIGFRLCVGLLVSNVGTSYSNFILKNLFPPDVDTQLATKIQSDPNYLTELVANWTEIAKCCKLEQVKVDLINNLNQTGTPSAQVLLTALKNAFEVQP